MERPELARLTSRSVATVGRWLQFGLPGGHPMLFPIATALNCSVAYLVGVRDTPEKAEYLAADERVMLNVYRQFRTAKEKREFVESIQETQAILERAQEC